MTPSLSTLRSLAEAATPGPWEALVSKSGNHDGIYHPFDKPDENGYNGSHVVMEGDSYLDSADAAFIAACSPEVILTLIGELEELRERVRLPNNIASWTADFLPHGDTSKVGTIQDAFDAMEKMDRIATLKITTLPKENLDSSVKKQ